MKRNPCKICGSYSRKKTTRDGKWVWIQCSKCELSNCTGNEINIEIANEMWNEMNPAVDKNASWRKPTQASKDVSDFPLVENSQLRVINKRLQDDLDDAMALIAKLKVMPLDMVALWQADINPIQGD